MHFGNYSSQRIRQVMGDLEAIQKKKVQVLLGDALLLNNGR